MVNKRNIIVGVGKYFLCSLGYALPAPCSTVLIQKQSVGHRPTLNRGTAKHLTQEINRAHAYRGAQPYSSCVNRNLAVFGTENNS